LASVLVRFGERLRAVRQKADLSQERLAERGLRNISLENIERLAEALDVELAALMPPREAKPPAQAAGPSRRPTRS
jgi:transcriptional regulator with XRE-family HTH domain